MADEVQSSPGLDARSLTEELGRSLWRAIPDGCDQVEYTVHGVASMLEEYADGHAPQGPVPLSVPDVVSDVARKLRAAMYRPGAGTWFTARFTVTRAGGMDADFNYDDEPAWDSPVDARAYRQDLERFPREDAAIPARLRAEVSKAI